METGIGIGIGFIFYIIIIIIISIIVYAAKKKENSAESAEKDELDETGLEISKQVSGRGYSFIVDTKSRKFAVKTSDLEKYVVFNYKDLINYEIIEDGNSIQKGRAGSALVGGFFLGGIGALVGSAKKKKTIGTCNTLVVHITINNIENPTCNIETIENEVKKSSHKYSKAKEDAQEIAALLNIIQTENEKEQLNKE